MADQHVHDGAARDAAQTAAGQHGAGHYAAGQHGAGHHAAPQITVLKGNPTAEELEAIGMVLAQLQAEAKAEATPADRNGWGAPRPAFHQASPLYNPHAFGSAVYY